MSNYVHIPYEGLAVTQAIFHDDCTTEYGYRIEPQGLEPAPLDLDLEEDDGVSFEVRQGTRKLGMQTSAWQANHKILHLPGWGGTFESPITQLEIERTRSHVPENSTLVNINMPGHGSTFASSSWPRSVRRDISAGSFLSAGEYLAPFYKNEIDNTPRIDIIGTSFGGRVALGLASAVKEPVDTLVMFDPPGTAHCSYKEFVHLYRVIEGETAQPYRNSSPDKQLQTLIDTSTRHTKIEQLRKLLGGSLMQYYYHEPKGMGAGKLCKDLSEANLTNVRRVAILSPKESSLNYWGTVADTLEYVAKKHAATQFEQWTFSGTHMITRYSSAVLGNLYGLVLAAEHKDQSAD